MDFFSCWDFFQIVLYYDDLEVLQTFAEEYVQTAVDEQSRKRGRIKNKIMLSK